MVRILVVDRNEAFATMLEQLLETNGHYEVEVAHAGSDALTLLRQSQFDLTIVDMDLDRKDIGYRDLILSMRQLDPTMRLMVIPILGQDLPPETRQLDIQGALSKPFFADDLLPNVEVVRDERSRHRGLLLRGDSLLAVEEPRGVLGLGDAVGVEHQDIAGIEVQGIALEHFLDV